MSPKLSEQELLSQLADLPREISPQHDPWPQISKAIGNTLPGTGSSKFQSSRWFMAAAASVMLAVFAGLVFNPMGKEKAETQEFLASGTPEQGQVEVNVYENTSVFRMINVIDAEYLAAFREFINTGDMNPGLTPQTVEKIEMGWADLRMTEEALAVALEKHPDNLFLNERMLELRARQLGFLKQLVSLDRNNRRLTI